MSTIPFKCPSCGNGTFRLKRKAESYEDLIGAPCDACGRILRKEDIEGKVRTIVEDKLKDAFKRLK
jgi:hypothetical protein